MLTFNDEDFKCEAGDVLVGYSMGGRVALKIAHRLKYQIKKVIILNANPLKLEATQKEARLVWEDSVTEKMQNMSVSDFLDYWNSLAIFKDDLPLTDLTAQELIDWSHTFSRYRLTQQADYRADLVNHPDKFSWIVGSRDQKYLGMAQESGVKFHTIPAGHRLFQHPEKIIELIKKENML